jgi:hypothetical protein
MMEMIPEGRSVFREEKQNKGMNLTAHPFVRTASFGGR